jgi:DNA-binding MarR family transcriptional regulator
MMRSEDPIRMTNGSGRSQWTFLTNHALVLIQVWRSPDITVRALAERVGITERATLRIIAELSEAGYVVRRRIGRNNHYSVSDKQSMRHPLVRQIGIDRLLHLIEPFSTDGA